ncbi:A disintegrin and metalloproteinase with thrombospondin motifs 14 isoform X3 [Lontra canadensis]|uniref:A disintegrin and metalloproteinase with thrombospondin motifs 14 isoform X3 n=1 Tax=Lontra canadensis TaxID=76717 RepID=UPI0013F31A8A|nr:A disintegrin and metalloproteinase with thrombospondin motifs 14 isoform X3 [Lontra canadensis]
MARLRALLSCLLPLHYALCASAGSRTPEMRLSGKLRDYGVTVPCSTDFRGRFLSHVLSGPAAASAGSTVAEGPPAPQSHSGPLRVARSLPRPEGATLHPGRVGRPSLYFNVTVFGEELHLRLRPNQRLVVPGASVEWQEDFRELFRQPLRRECVYTGDVMGMPGAAVAISNCDGLAGLIRTDSSDYFIEPLEWGQQEQEASGRTHVVYRREVRRQEWAEPGGDLHNEAFGLGDLPNLLGLVGQPLGDGERKRRHAKAGSYSIEVLLVVDDSVVRFHGKEHVQNYVLTLMNIVDEIYHDESLGAHINIALVRLIMVGYRQSLSLIERGNPSRSLEQVCRWAHSQQRQDPSHSEHHDHVVFLTRQDFGPSGSAWSMTVRGTAAPTRPAWAASWHPWCRLPSTASTGPAAAKWNSAATFPPTTASLMTRLCPPGPGPRSCQVSTTQWTSNAALTLALDTTPALHLEPKCRCGGWPLSPSTQFQTFEPCKQLWCSRPDNPYFCKTKKGPPLDGTECAPGQWCFKGHCIWKSLEQTYGQDGGWSSWTKFGSCSRSCGGGVRSRSRSCNNPPPAYGGRLCSGPEFQYQICNSEECPGPYEDFRAQQCAKRNSYYVHQNAKHSWLPYEPEDDAQKCELICRSEDTGDVVFMNQVVHDGTRCSYRDPYSVCARGECVPVGCDKEVGSMKADDKCGVCGGDNSHCRTVKGTLGKASKQAGALKLVQIPAGARHIQIEELEKVPHHIAVKNQVTGSFILNPKGKEAMSRTFTAMGLEWEYVVEDAKESLKTSGPLPEAIAVLVLPPAEGGPRSSLAYKYVIHEDLLPLIGSNNVLLEETDTYEWALKSWAPCTKSCGGGIQFTKYGCRRRRDHHMVQRHLCDHRKRPKPIRRRCNQHPCAQPVWVTEEWGACSRSCGKLGVQTRGVQCLLPLSNGTHKAMPAKACPGDRPEARRPCFRVPCPAQWRMGAWSQCSATCGEGIQQRQVVCRTNANSLGQCEGDKPDTVQVCSLPACAGNLQNSTVNTDIQEPVTPEEEWVPQSGPLHPINKISSTEPCTGDRSIFCRMEVLDRYCSIPGYHRLCCESCTKRAVGPDASLDLSLTSPPPFSTPGSPLLGPEAPPDAVEPTVGPTGADDHQHGRPTQLPRPLGTSSPVTQHHSPPQNLSPRASWGTSPSTPRGLPWGWTRAPVPVSKDKRQLREAPKPPGTSLPTTSLVT